MATLVEEVIEDVRRHVYGSSRVELNKLADAVDAVNDTMTFEYDLEGIVRGNYIAIDDEIIYIVNTVRASKTATVVRGYLGSTPASHTEGALVEVNPRFPRDFIKKALQRELNSYAPRLFRVTAHDISHGGTTTEYDMPTSDFIHVIDIRRKSTGVNGRPILRGWDVARDQDAGIFSSGIALLVPHGTPSGVLRVRIARSFDASNLADDTDLVADIGMPYTSVDIPAYGTAWRLLSTREIGRTSMQAQPEPRHAEEVPPGHISSVVTQLKNLRDHRLAEEAFLLREKYPLRIR